MSERETHQDEQHEITRRTLIGGAAAVGAAAALPTSAEARAPRRRSRRTGGARADVVVVGAGLAGLTAARELVRRGRSVIVLEARNRVGGRTLNHHFRSGGKDKVIEVGGQWVGPTQDHIVRLGKDMGVGTFKTYNEGQYIYHQNGMNSPYSPNGPLGAVPPDYTGAADAEQALIKLDRMAAQINIDAPYESPSAQDYDSQTFETWKQNNTTTAGGRTLLDLGIESVFAAEPRDISLLWVLFYIRAAGNEQNVGTFERLINTAGGAQESRFLGGSQLVSQRLAHRLGRRVHLSTPVRRIVQSRGGVTVVSDKLTVRAKQVIVTGPPALTATIDYEPALPAERAQLTQRFPQGTVIKCEAFYDHPFWRDDGLAGQATSDTGSREDHLRQLAARRPAGGAARLHRGPGGPRGRTAERARSARRGASELRALLRREGVAAHGLRRDELVHRAVDPRLLRRVHAARRAARLRARDPRADRTHSLGRLGDRDVLGRLHGRRGALGRAGRARGPALAMSGV